MWKNSLFLCVWITQNGLYLYHMHVTLFG
jgi:hypothetical protein